MFLHLVDDVRAAFIARGYTDVGVDEGVEASNTQTNYGTGSARRVVFTPSADPMLVIPPRFIGEDDTGKRQLINVNFVFEVSLAAYDADQPDRDLAHKHRCWDLFEVVVQAVQSAYWGEHEWTSPTWNTVRKHLQYGSELVATLTLNIPIFDVGSTLHAAAPVPGEPKPVT